MCERDSEREKRRRREREMRMTVQFSVHTVTSVRRFFLIFFGSAKEGRNVAPHTTKKLALRHLTTHIFGAEFYWCEDKNY